jgi:hypothetical protein
VIASTGWSWGQVGSLTLPQLAELNRYWKAHPPLHIIVQAIAEGMSGKSVGQRDVSSAVKAKNTETTAEDLMAYAHMNPELFGVRR